MVQNVALEGLTGPSLKQTMDEIQKGLLSLNQALSSAFFRS